MAALDWIFLGVLAASLLIGAWRGLVFEVLSLFGWVVSFFVAQWFAQDVANWLPMGESAGGLRYAAGFVIVFIASVFAFGFLTSLAKKLIDAIDVRPADRALGAVFGLLRGAVLLLAVAVVAGLTPMGAAAWWQESQAAPILAEVLQRLKPVLPEEFSRHLPP